MFNLGRFVLTSMADFGLIFVHPYIFMIFNPLYLVLFGIKSLTKYYKQKGSNDKRFYSILLLNNQEQSQKYKFFYINIYI